MKLDPKKLEETRKRMKAECDRFMALSPEEKTKEVAIFDRELTDEETRPPTPEETAIIRGIIKRGRPKTGRHAKRVLISLDENLLARADAHAKAEHITRSAMIARGLKLAMARKPKKVRAIR